MKEKETDVGLMGMCGDSLESEGRFERYWVVFWGGRKEDWWN